MNFKDIMCDNLLLIVPSNQKEEIVYQISLLDQIYSYKILSDVELKKALLFDYDYKAIIYVMNECDVKYQIAKEYIESMYFLNNKTYKSNKLNKLVSLKEKLIQKGLLYTNPQAKKLLLNKKVVVYGFDVISKEQKIIFSNLNEYEIYNELITNKQQKVYRFDTLENEVDAVCYEISKLIHSGVNINNIKLANVNGDYLFTLKRYFKMYNLPLNIQSETTLYSLRQVKDFYNKCCENNSLQEGLDYFFNEYKQEDVYKKILNICNKLVGFDFIEIKELLKELLKEETIANKNYENCVEIVSLDNLSISKDEYVFVLSINQGIYPTSYKNDEFLSDDEKKELSIDTSHDKNILAKQRMEQLLNKSDKLFLSYKEKSAFATFNKSFVLNELDVKEEAYQRDYLISYSQSKDKLKLAKIYDKIYQQNTQMYINVLASNYDIEYKTYDHRFKRFDGKKIVNYIEENHKNISYSSIDNYFKCGFRYFLNNILSAGSKEQVRAAKIGEVFHNILEASYKENFDFELEFKKEYEKLEDVITKFYVSKLKNTLIDIININKENMKDSRLTSVVTEKKVEVIYDEPIKTKFKGYIDKLYYTTINNKTYVAIIDYKTGDPDLNIDKVDYGLSLQLPIYLYLLKHSNMFNDVECCGFYLQKLLPKTISFDDGYEKTIKELTMLQGYSNSSKSILSILDPHYENSSMIKSMKVTKAGAFDRYAKVISSEDMNNLADKIENKIKQALKEISECKFDITPKIVKSKDVSCAFCEFKECCYKKYDDNVFLDEQEKETVGE